jgi:hypothetical protein
LCSVHPACAALLHSHHTKNNILNIQGEIQLRTLFRFFAAFVGVVIGITACAITVELLTGGRNPMINAVFGIIGGSLGWMLVGKKPAKENQE